MNAEHAKYAELQLNAHDAGERRALTQVLGINLAQAAVGGTVGLLVHSVGLLGAALDNLADAGVYAVSLYAVGRTFIAKARAARLPDLLIGLVVVTIAINGGREILEQARGTRQADASTGGPES